MKPLLILYYHRILPFLGYDINLELFQWQLAFLRKHFDIVPPEVLYELREGKKLNKASVLITFDDGFLDNFVYAYPVLKKYSVKALIFVITSKISNRQVRPRFDEFLSGKISKDALFVPNRNDTALKNSLDGELDEFLSWDELKIMRESGVFEIGSHSHNHVKVFSSEKIVGFYSEDCKVHWSYKYALGDEPKEGYPIFPLRSYLLARRFFPFKDFIENVREIYKRYGLGEAFERVNYIGERGLLESDDEFEDRIKEDLLTSKELIRKNLDFDTPFLSWPWGEFSNESKKIAMETGFLFCFSTEKRAFFGNDFCEIGRIKAPQSKGAFLRKLLINKTMVGSRLYKVFH